MEPVGDLSDGQTVQIKLGQNFKFEKLHTASDERVDLSGGRKTKHPGNLLCCRKLGIDKQRDAQTLFDEIDLLAVDGIAHAGDRVTVACLLCDQTAEQIELVGTCYGDQDVGGFDPGFHQCVDTGTVTDDAHRVDIITEVIDLAFFNVDEGDIRVFLLQFFGQCAADFAAAYDYNVHDVPLL